ncbi:MAG TPA: NUDIX hydrolase [Rhabdochlamydiaceae bacterium]|jgi:8-oxo-dGTP pyrophosphatase MutT (NUDIX family)|nr:NUDIX hydrolase [Rhabdochlamydiaceae bacterium]
MNYKFYFEKPKGFKGNVEVAGCFCEWNGKVLYLKRHAEKPHGQMWGLPAGKLEAGEDPLRAAVREVKEEVGITLNPEKLEHVATVYLEADGLHYTFHAFRVGLEKAPRIELEPQEHTEAKWLSVEEALKLPLIIGGAEILKAYKTKISSS